MFEDWAHLAVPWYAGLHLWKAPEARTRIAHRMSYRRSTRMAEPQQPSSLKPQRGVMASTRPAVRNVRPRAELRERVTRPASSHRTRGGRILLQPFVREPIAELLPARDLARLCAVSRRHHDHAAALALVATHAHHGLALRENATLADMHSLDGVPDTLSVDLREHGSRLVRKGSPLSTTYVGSYKDKVTLAQLPPAAGDTW